MATHLLRASTEIGGRPQRSSLFFRMRHSLILRRVILAIPLLLIVSSLTFVLTSLSPGDPASQILGISATPEALAKLRESLGLNLPVWEQYWDWLRHAATGNLGTSITSSEPVFTIILNRLPVTLSLVIGALVVTGIVGIGLGVVAALRGRFVARAIDALGLIGFAVPSFWLASELVAVFAVQLHLLPAIGYTNFEDSPIGWFTSLILPVTALSLASVAFVAKQTRESMSGVLGAEYVRMARAHGVRPWSLIIRYSLRNASIPVVTVIGVQTIGLLAGTLFVEQVFSLPGLGSLLVQSALSHDLPVVEGVAVTFTLLVVLINIAVDLAYSRLNPRVRTQ